MQDTGLINSAAEFTAGFEEHSAGILRCPDEMRLLIQTGFLNKNLELLHDISFAAKYVAGMKNVLVSAMNNPEFGGTDKIQGDLAAQMTEIREKLGSFLAGAPESFRTHIENNFLAMNTESFARLNSLLSDLENLKLYFNLLMRAAE